MIREIIKIDTGQIVEIRDYCSGVEYNMDRIIETDQGIFRTIEVTLEKEILEVDTEGVTEVIIMKEAGVYLGIDGTQMIPEQMIEVVVGLYPVQEPVPREIELDAINVENVNILPRTVQIQK